MVDRVEQLDPIKAPESLEDVVTQSVIDLYDLEWEILKKNTIQTPDILKTIQKYIQEDPEQPPEQEDQEKLGDLLKKWKVSEAVSAALDMIFDIFGWSKKKAWLDDFKKYTVDYTKVSDEELEKSLVRLQNKVTESWLSVHQKLRFTYAFSRAKDEKIARETPQATAFDKLAKNIQEWDILLMNKDWKTTTLNSKIANEWLQQASNSIRTHVVMVTKVSWNDIEITHATTPAVKTDNLQSYLKGYTAVDLCALQQPPASRRKFIDDAKALLGKPYDAKAAAKQTLTWKNERDDKYNCGELIGEALYSANPTMFKGLEDKSFPSDFLMNNYLQPSYMTTIVS